MEEDEVAHQTLRRPKGIKPGGEKGKSHLLRLIDTQTKCSMLTIYVL